MTPETQQLANDEILRLADGDPHTVNVARATLETLFALYTAQQKPRDQLTEREALLIALHGDDDR